MSLIETLAKDFAANTLSRLDIIKQIFRVTNPDFMIDEMMNKIYSPEEVKLLKEHNIVEKMYGRYITTLQETLSKYTDEELFIINWSMNNTIVSEFYEYERQVINMRLREIIPELTKEIITLLHESGIPSKFDMGLGKKGNKGSETLN